MREAVPGLTGDIAASVAAGGTLHLVNRGRKRRTVAEERLRLARETHELLHQVHGDAARRLGHVTGIARARRRAAASADPWLTWCAARWLAVDATDRLPYGSNQPVATSGGCHGFS